MDLDTANLQKHHRRQRGQTRLAIYDFIVEFSQQYGFPPTIREIARAVGVSSPGTVSTHLRRLEEERLIQRYSNHARAIRTRDIL